MSVARPWIADAAWRGEAVLVDRCDITVIDDPDDFTVNATTLVAEPATTVTTWVPCTVSPATPRERSAGGNAEAVGSHVIRVPASQPVPNGALVEVVACDTAGLEGARFRVVAQLQASAQVFRRVLAERAQDTGGLVR